MAIFRYWFSVAVIWGFKRHWPLGQAPAYLDSILLVGDQIDTGLHSGMGPFPQHILPQLVDIWDANGQVRAAALRPPGRPCAHCPLTHLRTCPRSCQSPDSASFSGSSSWHPGCRWAGWRACLQRTDRPCVAWWGLPPTEPPTPAPSVVLTRPDLTLWAEVSVPVLGRVQGEGQLKRILPLWGGACSGRLSRDAPVITPSQC